LPKTGLASAFRPLFLFLLLVMLFLPVHLKSRFMHY
jgi:hypothetical protein